MATVREYPRSYARPVAGRPSRLAAVEPKRSNAAIPAAIVVVLLGAYLARYTLFAPGVLGLLLLISALSFLSTRLNPLSATYYLTRKPSWAAIGVVALGSIVLLSIAYAEWVHGAGPVPAGL